MSRKQKATPRRPSKPPGTFCVFARRVPDLADAHELLQLYLRSILAVMSVYVGLTLASPTRASALSTVVGILWFNTAVGTLADCAAAGLFWLWRRGRVSTGSACRFTFSVAAKAPASAAVRHGRPSIACR